MANENLIRLGPTGDIQDLSAFGRNFIQRWEDGLTREERAADGTLRRDIISRKRAWTISYETIDQSAVDRFEELNQLSEELTLEVTEVSGIKTYTVLMGVFEKERLLAVLGGLWAGLSIEFREV